VIYTLDSDVILAKECVCRTVSHHPFYYRRAHHGFHRRAAVFIRVCIVLGCVLGFLVLMYLVNFLIL